MLPLANLGCSLGLLLLFRRHLDLMVFFVASLILDLVSLIYFLTGYQTNFYIPHTFLFGGLLGIIVAYLIHAFRLFSSEYWHYFYPDLNWQSSKDFSWSKLLFSGVAGVWSRIIIELTVSLGFLSLEQVYFISLALFLVALFIGFRITLRRIVGMEEGIEW